MKKGRKKGKKDWIDLKFIPLLPPVLVGDT